MLKTILCALCMLLLPSTVNASTSKNIEDIQTFIFDYDNEHREASHTPGWTFAWVQGEQRSVQSFGVKDINTRTEVNGDTVFRIASVSKVFVAVAVQQLLEQQRVALDADIALYLPGFQSLNHLPYAISLRHLLTHTAGFEDKFYGDSVRNKAETQSLEAHLTHSLPKQLHKPGEIIRYSNYGNALAALVVEKVSGVKFHQYVYQHILQPSGMNNSGFLLTEALNTHRATGYRHSDGEFQERPYTWVHRYPPTSMLTTGNDMAKFIAMLVNGGQGEDGHVLASESVQQMFSTHFTHDIDIPGMALGWMEFQRYGNKTLYHDGGTPGYVAQLVIMPEQRAGYFIAANQKNSDLPEGLRYDFLKAFFDNSHTEEFAVVEPELPLSAYAGSFQNTRRNYSSFEAFAVLMSREVEIKLSDSGNTLIHWDREYVPYAPHKFVNLESGHKLVFKVDRQAVNYLTLDWGGAPRAYKKLNRLQKSKTQIFIMTGILVCCLLVIVVALVLIWKKHTNVSTELLANGLIQVFFILLAAWSVNLDTLLIRLAEISVLKALLLLPILALLTVILHLFQKKFHWLRLLAMTPVVAALLWLHQYNLLGWWFY